MIDRHPLRRAARAVRGAGVRPAVPGQFGVLLGVHELMRGLARAGSFLDDRFHPGWRNAELGSPLFIIACPRSGTTLLHRLMSLDEDRFTSLKLYQTLLPGVTWTRIFEAFRAVDRAVGSPLTRSVGAMEEGLFGTWDHIHRVSFGDAEEDEWLWMNERHSPGWLLFYPQPSALREQTFVDGLDEATRSHLRDRYADTLRRHMHAEGRGRTLLLKNALVGGRLDVVDEVAPTARYIQLVRDPYRSVSSFVSMFMNVIRVLTPGVPLSGQVSRELCALGCAYYARMDEFVGSLPPERALTVRYDDLVASPRDAVEGVYAHFGIPLTGSFRARLDQATRAQRRHVSGHSYSLKMFGLEPAMIHGPLEEVFERHGFERMDATP
ncbi:MAG: sulfotransferase [Deltaproteobacteria bacterium]|nr:MAG: sulfotransferase [Deltaproteobacteria bacterium]